MKEISDLIKKLITYKSDKNNNKERTNILNYIKEYIKNENSKINEYNCNEIRIIQLNNSTFLIPNKLMSKISTDEVYLGNKDSYKITKDGVIKGLYEHTEAIKQIGSQGTGGIIATYLTLKILGEEGIKKII